MVLVLAYLGKRTSLDFFILCHNNNKQALTNFPLSDIARKFNVHIDSVIYTSV